MKFTEMLKGTVEDVAAITEEDIRAEAYAIEYYDYSPTERDVCMALKTRLKEIEAPIAPFFARYYEPPADEWEETIN